MEDGLLKCVVEFADGTEKKLQFVLPKSKTSKVLRDIHDAVS